MQHRPLATDNAQSWFRHVIAEFGFVGSIPMLWWCVVLAMLMLTRIQPAIACRSACCEAVLIGFGVASIFGMPAQSIAIIMTFWVFVFWLWLEATHARIAPRRLRNRVRGLGTR